MRGAGICLGVCLTASFFGCGGDANNGQAGEDLTVSGPSADLTNPVAADDLTAPSLDLTAASPGLDLTTAANADLTGSNVPPPDLTGAAGCVSASQCAAGQICNNGACGPCSMSSQCKAGQVCNAGACGPCTNSSQCGTGYVCTTGQCVPASAPPSTPGSPQVTVGATFADISWTPSTASSPNTIASYNVYYYPLSKGAPIAGTEAIQGRSPITALPAVCSGNLCKLTLNGLYRKHAYQFAVSAVDSLSVESAKATLSAMVPNGYTWMLPRPYDSRISVLRCLPGANPQRCYAAGDRGFLVQSNDGGATWSEIDPGGGGNNTAGNSLNTRFYSPCFYDIAMPDATKPDLAFLVGRGVLDPNRPAGYDIVRKTTDGGSTWVDVTPPQLTAPVRDGLMTCLSATQCWAMLGGNLFVTSDGAGTWTKLHGFPDKGVPLDMNRLIFRDIVTGFALDQSNTVWQTIDGGKSWATLFNMSKVGNLTDLDLAQDQLHAAASSDSAPTPAMFTTDGFSTSMKSAFSPSQPVFGMNAIQFVQPGSVLLVGDPYDSYASSVLLSGDSGATFNVHNGNLPTRDVTHYLGAFFSDGNHGIVYGVTGNGLQVPQIWQTSNLQANSPTFTERSYTLPHWHQSNGVFTDPINAGVAIDASTFIGCANAGNLVFTKDGGATFTEMPSGLASCTTGFSAVYPVLGNNIAITSVTATTITGIVSGNKNNAGSYYAAIASFTLDRVGGGISVTSPWANLNVSPILAVAINGTNGVAVGNSGTILTSNNTGASWSIATSPTNGGLLKVKFYDPNTVYIIGEGDLVKGTLAGSTWSFASVTTGNGQGTWPAGGRVLEFQKDATSGDLLVYIFTRVDGLVIWDPAKTKLQAWSQRAYPLNLPAISGGMCNTATHCMLVGPSPFVITTHDGGVTWRDTSNWAGKPGGTWQTVTGYNGITMVPPSNGNLDPNQGFLFGSNSVIVALDNAAE